MEAIHSALSSRRFSRLLFWLGFAVLAAGVVVLIVKFVGGSGPARTTPDKGFKPTLPAATQPLKNAQGVTVTTYSQLDSDIKLAIRRFVVGAVAGKNYADSWNYIAPSLRRGYTHKTWTTSDEHPVIPYPVDNYDSSGFRLTEATTKEILVVLRLTAAPKLHLRPVAFQIGLVPLDGRWLVNYWMPRATPPVPIN